MSARRRLPGERAQIAVRGRVRSKTAAHGEILLGRPGDPVVLSLIGSQPDEPSPSLRFQVGRTVTDLPISALVESVLIVQEPGYDDDFGRPLVPCGTTGPDGQISTSGAEVWGNDRMTVHVQRFDPVKEGAVEPEDCPMVLSVHTHNRDSEIRWRILQRVKNEIAGYGRWAAEWFPDEDHLVDEANERHLWVMPAGFEPPAWMACSAGRMVGNSDEASKVGAQQSPLPSWYPETKETRT